MKQLCEHVQGLAYKLRMMGITCEGPACLHGDNQHALAYITIVFSLPYCERSSSHL